MFHREMLMKSRWALRVVSVLLACGTALPLRAGAQTQAASVTVPVLAAPPSMNGTIDASWAAAARVVLARDYTYQRAASEPTTVYVAQDSGALDIAFVADQREALADRQATNGVNVMSDDYVGVYLYPNGIDGFGYSFVANPQGARYQTSSENSAYAPQWTAVGHVSENGYIVTMRIPFSIIRNGGSTAWKVQFVRATVATGGLAVWTFSSQQHNANDPYYAGTLTGVGVHSVAQRPQPRLQLYGLGELTTKANGGNTSRVGLDASLPVTRTSSFVVTLHPDYSNVEIDQQTISPTAFQRQYSEVRPFFTQAASFFNGHFSCSDCPQTLYTPAIPIFGQGYAYEGTQGPLSYAAFEAIGDERIDDAQTLNYASQNAHGVTQLNAQRVGVSVPGLNDDVSTLDAGYLDTTSHIGVYANGGQDRQSTPFGATTGGYLETGPVYVTPTTTIASSIQRIGSDFSPVDGYVSQNDIYGYENFVSQTFNFKSGFLLHDIVAQAFYARYHNHDDLTDQADATLQVNFDFKNLVTLHAYASNQGIGVPAYANDVGRFELLPFSGNGFYLGYKVNTTTPSYVQYSGGPYYHGNLDAWSYVTTIPLVRRLNLALEADSDRYLPSTYLEPATTQWLERASLDWQINRDAELLVGVRRIVGTNVPNAFQVPQYGSPGPCSADPYLPGCYIDTSNVSLAYHFLAAHNEFYVVYGNPNDLSTLPALYFKWIRYIGAEKGT